MQVVYIAVVHVRIAQPRRRSLVYVPIIQPARLLWGIFSCSIHVLALPKLSYLCISVHELCIQASKHLLILFRQRESLKYFLALFEDGMSIVIMIPIQNLPKSLLRLCKLCFYSSKGFNSNEKES
jgi:hypothetical protein